MRAEELTLLLRQKVKVFRNSLCYTNFHFFLSLTFKKDAKTNLNSFQKILVESEDSLILCNFYHSKNAFFSKPFPINLKDFFFLT